MQTEFREARCPRCKVGLLDGASQCPACGFVLGGPAAIRSAEVSSLRFRLSWLSLLPVALGIGVLVFLNFRLTSSDAYKDSIAIAASSAEVKTALGDGIKAGWPVLGYSLPLQKSAFAQWSVEIRGSRGKGRLYGVANQVHGLWEFSRLAVVTGAGDQRIDLNRSPRRLPFPPAPVQTVYLIPFGLSEGETLD